MIVPPIQVCSHTYLFVRLAALMAGTITVCILSLGGGKVVSMVYKLALHRNGIVALGVSTIVCKCRLLSHSSSGAVVDL